MNTKRERSRFRYLGIALTTCSMLLLQVYLTRVFTVLFHSSFAFLAISIAFLGLGSAGVFAYVFPGLFPPDRHERRVAITGLLYVVAVGGPFLLLLTLDNAIMAGRVGSEASLGTYVIRVLIAGVLMVPAYFCAGLVLSILFRRHVAAINRLYFADLLGAGIGCLLVLPLLSVVGGDSAVFFICTLAAAGTWMLALAAGERGIARTAGLLIGLTVILLVANQVGGVIEVRSHATNTGGAGRQRCPDKAVKSEKELYSAWNAFSRIGVFETMGGHELYVRIDSSCQTTIPVYSEQAVAALSRDLTFERLPFLLDRHRRYLEIGAGGGAGMLVAHNLGAERVVGVEINDITVDCAKRIFAERCGMPRLFAIPGIDLIVDEGRSFVTQTDERFDALTITFIQTGAAAGATAFALSEANLFTVEAFAEFLGKLDADGLFYVYRHGGNQMLRLISIVRRAFEAIGVDEVVDRLFIAKDPLLNHAVLMAGRRPFTAAEIDTLEAGSRRLGLKVLYSPGKWNEGKRENALLDELRGLRREGRYSWATIQAAYNRQHRDDSVVPIEHAYLTATDPEAFAADYFLDIRATTDDRPYFFFFSVNRLTDLGMAFQFEGLEYLGSIVVLLFYLLVLFTGLVCLLIALPLILRRRAALRGGGKSAFLLYFAILGIAYISIEISFIQRFVLFLGHPIYAVSVVLMAFLVCTGLGSFFSDALFRRGWLTLPRTIVLLAAILLLYNHLLPAVFHSPLISLPVPLKIVVSCGLILPLAFLMGILFPQGMRRVERADPALVPWVWGANSATSVIGSIVSLVLAIHLGFSVVLYLGAGLYLTGLLVIRHRVWRAAS
jgi:spermidine synthase